MHTDLVIMSCNGPVATITINRPAAMNAMTETMIEQLGTCVTQVAENSAIRVAIITGAGEKAFIAGADIAAMQGMDVVQGRALARRAHAVYRAIELSEKPYIAAVNGYALGGGCELALACDIRIASEKARFGQPEITIGVLPGFGGSQRLPRIIGKGRALEMILTGTMIDAHEAYRIGLVNTVVPDTQLLETANRLAQQIASKSSLIIGLCKQAVTNGLEMDLDRALPYEAELFGLCFGTKDQKEGMAAFLEKRPAVFEDR